MFLVLGSAMFSIGGVKTVIESHQTRKHGTETGSETPSGGRASSHEPLGFGCQHKSRVSAEKN